MNSLAQLGVPDDADSFGLLDCLHIERAPSKHVPGETIAISTLKCPGCAANHGRPRHVAITLCPCGLNLVPNGVEVLVWRRDEKPSDDDAWIRALNGTTAEVE